MLLSVNIYSQELAVTIKGDTLEIFENGTWKKYNPKKSEVSKIESSVKVIEKVDEFTNEKLISTESWIKFASSTYVNIGGKALKNTKLGTIGFSLLVRGDLGCLSKQDSSMMIKLSNDEVVPMTYMSDTDCSDLINGGWIALSKEDFKNPKWVDIIKENNELLKNYNWTKIRITGTDGFVDLAPNVNRKMKNPEQFFREHITAIKSHK